jgi:hypothetical protein
MPKLRETLNPDEKMGALGGPTRIKTPENQHPLHCSECADLYYVDETTYRDVMRAVEFDPSENPFICDRCSEEEAEEERARG